MVHEPLDMNERKQTSHHDLKSTVTSQISEWHYRPSNNSSQNIKKSTKHQNIMGMMLLLIMAENLDKIHIYNTTNIIFQLGSGPGEALLGIMGGGV